MESDFDKIYIIGKSLINNEEHKLVFLATIGQQTYVLRGIKLKTENNEN